MQSGLMVLLVVVILLLIIPTVISIWAFARCWKNSSLGYGGKIGWAIAISVISPLGAFVYPFMFAEEAKLQRATQWSIAAMVLLFGVAGVKFYKEYPQNPVLQEAVAKFRQERPTRAALLNIKTMQSQVSVEENETFTSQQVAGFYAQCQEKQVDSCLRLGIAYRHGKGAKVNKEYALFYFNKACAEGIGKGCRYRAEMSMPPFGTATDLETSELFLQGCRNNDLRSCSNLVSMLAGGPVGINKYGEGVDPYRLKPEPWIGEVAQLMTTACEKDDGEQCANIAKLAYRGVGTSRSSSRALELYEKACQLEQWESCARASKLYLEGDGVEKNMNRGLELAKRGMAGSQQSLKNLRAPGSVDATK